MREYKFKVWENNSWNIYSLQDFVSAGFNCPGWLITEADKIREYTGLKDKNGVEIYEGDILRRQCKCCNEPEFQDRSPMVFRKGSFRLIKLNSYYNIEDFEVIGNIYENLDLLESTE